MKLKVGEEYTLSIEKKNYHVKLMWKDKEDEMLGFSFLKTKIKSVDLLIDWIDGKLSTGNHKVKIQEGIHGESDKIASKFVHQNDRPQQDTAVLRHGSGLV